MATDLISIGSSGALAARRALDVTAQNIANAATPDYVRRNVRLSEVALAGTVAGSQDTSLGGARVAGVVRQADAFRQAEARRTGSDLARADAELAGLEEIEGAVENAGVFDAIADFEASLQQLTGDPVNGALRASTLERGRTLASSFNIAASALDSNSSKLRLETADGVAKVNRQLQELANLNVKIVRTAAGSGNQALLLDRRDALLQSLSEQVGISTRIADDQSVEVRAGGATGPLLVAGPAQLLLSQSVHADGTPGFAVGGMAANISSGALAGKAQALSSVAAASARLDAIASSIASIANASQANGVDLDGNAGRAMFVGTGAQSLALALESGSQIATAPAGAGAGANSRDGSNLAALRLALTEGGVAGEADSLMFDVSATVAGRKVTQSALDAIATSARAAVDEQSAVDLDQEAANLLRYQQAFQASARVIQVASTVFDTLLAAR